MLKEARSEMPRYARQSLSCFRQSLDGDDSCRRLPPLTRYLRDVTTLCHASALFEIVI